MNAEEVNPSSEIRAVVYACSGCSDTGELADRITRRLAADGLAEMSCLAGIAARLKPFLEKARRAPVILAVDGCPLNCVRHTLQLAGLEVRHLQLNDIGFRKGHTLITGENIAIGTRAAIEMLENPSRPPARSEMERRT